MAEIVSVAISHQTRHIVSNVFYDEVNGFMVSLLKCSLHILASLLVLGKHAQLTFVFHDVLVVGRNHNGIRSISWSIRR